MRLDSRREKWNLCRWSFSSTFKRTTGGLSRKWRNGRSSRARWPRSISPHPPWNLSICLLTRDKVRGAAALGLGVLQFTRSPLAVGSGSKTSWLQKFPSRLAENQPCRLFVPPQASLRLVNTEPVPSPLSMPPSRKTRRLKPLPRLPMRTKRVA